MGDGPADWGDYSRQIHAFKSLREKSFVLRNIRCSCVEPSIAPSRTDGCIDIN